MGRGEEHTQIPIDAGDGRRSSGHRFRMCTIAARNYLPSVELLVRSFVARHPSIPVSVLVVDGCPTDFWTGLDFEVVLPTDLGLDGEEFGRMATYYDVTELSTALKPNFMRHLLGRGDDVVMYLDPDIEVFAPLADLFTAALEHEIVLTPHVTEPIPRDGHTFAEESLLLSGQFNLGFVALSAAATPFLDYWAPRTRRHALCDTSGGYFTDQRWVDAVPSLFPHTIVRDRGCNVAYWNLHERPLRHDGERWTSGGVPLRFFHFSGHRAEDPYVLSVHLGAQGRIRVDREPELRRMLGERATRLRDVTADVTGVPYRFARTPDGIRLDASVRRLYWETVGDAEQGRVAMPPQPFGADGGLGFTEWLCGAQPGTDQVPRHLMATWRARPDLQAAFPDVAGPDGGKLRHWASVDRQYLDVTPPQLVPADPVRTPGVNLVGYLDGEFGVGAASRLLGAGVRAAGLPMSVSVVRPPQQHNGARYTSGLEGLRFSLSLLAMNADGLIGHATTPAWAALGDGPRVGIWYWEVGVFPEPLHAAFALVDEVWCSTHFVRDAIAPHATVPVRVHPLVLERHVPSALGRADLGLPVDRYLFGFAFDHASVIRRKNPAGLIDAYCDAFGPDDGAALVLKSINSERAVEEAAELRERAAGRPDVLFLDRRLDSTEMRAFFGVLDAYVSLHRSEGLGLTMASAMAAGVPVIATGWSGNLEYMGGSDAFLVPFRLEEVGAGADPYPASAVWAEPDLHAAASHLRACFDDPDRAAAVGALGAQAVARLADPGRAGDWIAERFSSLTGTELAGFAPVAGSLDPLAVP